MIIPTVIVRALAPAMLLAGCATPYKANGLGGGFVDERIDDNAYSVAFHGNSLAKHERVWNFWFYRCAELTREKGYSAFAVAPGSPAAKTSDNGSPWLAVKGGGYVPHYYYAPNP